MSCFDPNNNTVITNDAEITLSCNLTARPASSRVSHCESNGCGLRLMFSQSCNSLSCYWIAGAFGECSALCGGGTQNRSNTCFNPNGNVCSLVEVDCLLTSLASAHLQAPLQLYRLLLAPLLHRPLCKAATPSPAPFRTMCTLPLVRAPSHVEAEYRRAVPPVS